MTFKDYYDGKCAHRLSALLKPNVEIDADQFARNVDKRVSNLELKDRVGVIAEELWHWLPTTYPAAVAVLTKSLGPELREDQGMFNHSWFLMPIARFVEEYGQDYPEDSLAAIEAITKRHTGEFAIRPYLHHWHDMTMERVHTWASSSSHNVRRLASEGIRTRLPWAARFQPFIQNPTPLIQVISTLINDPSHYVRTSVANNLNDISKDNPDIAIATAKQWLHQSDTKETQWIIHKGLRTLIKKGNPAALSIVGAEADPNISAKEVHISPHCVNIGQPALIKATIENNSKQTRKIIVDYQIHFRKHNGTTRPTTFKLSKITLAAGENKQVQKQHSFKITNTRTYYAGTQGLSVQANGKTSEVVEFELKNE